MISAVLDTLVRLARKRPRRMGIRVLALAALAFGVSLVGHADLAFAQAQVPPAAEAARAAAPAAQIGSEAMSHTSKSGAIFFWIFALATLGGAVFVITRRNLITAVMGMVGTFFALAALYAMLYASFLTAIQVLVYAGAIMVLFVFVIMILNKPEAEPWSTTGIIGKVVTVALLGVVVWRLASVLWSIVPPDGSLGVPEPVLGEDFGSTRAVGATLFTRYLFPFEAVSLVLLIAVVGAIAVARPHERLPHALGESTEDGKSAATKS